MITTDLLIEIGAMNFEMQQTGSAFNIYRFQNNNNLFGCNGISQLLSHSFLKWSVLSLTGKFYEEQNGWLSIVGPAEHLGL